MPVPVPVPGQQGAQLFILTGASSSSVAPAAATTFDA